MNVDVDDDGDDDDDVVVVGIWTTEGWNHPS